jgi:hypothetical protein
MRCAEWYWLFRTITTHTREKKADLHGVLKLLLRIRSLNNRDLKKFLSEIIIIIIIIIIISSSSSSSSIHLSWIGSYNARFDFELIWRTRVCYRFAWTLCTGDRPTNPLQGLCVNRQLEAEGWTRHLVQAVHNHTYAPYTATPLKSALLCLLVTFTVLVLLYNKSGTCTNTAMPIL